VSRSYKDLLKLFKNVFKPAYADLVAYIGDKPINILVEMENTLSHIFTSFDESKSPNVRQENIEKAYNHLVRATLDCYKLLWVHINKEIDEIFRSDTKRFALTISESDFLKLRNLFKEKAREARRKELNNIGCNPLAPVKDYMEAIRIGKQITNSVDDEREGRARKFTLRAKLEELVASFVIGVVTGIIATMIYNWWIFAH
jgi:hypothetical protein